MLRMELACICVLIFISIMFFRGKKAKSRLRNMFSAVLISSVLNLIFDAITVYSVNHMYRVSALFNSICHRIFTVLILLVVYFFQQYILLIIEDEIGAFTRKKLYKVLGIATNLSLAAGLTIAATCPITYEITANGCYSSGPYVFPVYVLSPLYMLEILVAYLLNRKHIRKKKRFAVVIPLSTEAIAFIIAACFPSTLLTGMAITLMALSLYLIMENPDLELLEEARIASEVK